MLVTRVRIMDRVTAMVSELKSITVLVFWKAYIFSSY